MTELLSIANEEVKKLRAENARLHALLREVRETMNHAHIFIYTREKMHSDGRLLYEACMRQVNEVAALNTQSGDKS